MTVDSVYPKDARQEKQSDRQPSGADATLNKCGL